VSGLRAARANGSTMIMNVKECARRSRSQRAKSPDRNAMLNASRRNRRRRSRRLRDNYSALTEHVDRLKVAVGLKPRRVRTILNLRLLKYATEQFVAPRTGMNRRTELPRIGKALLDTAGVQGSAAVAHAPARPAVDTSYYVSSVNPILRVT
jgi:hypothetical protein